MKNIDSKCTSNSIRELNVIDDEIFFLSTSASGVSATAYCTTGDAETCDSLTDHIDSEDSIQ